MAGSLPSAKRRTRRPRRGLASAPVARLRRAAARAHRAGRSVRALRPQFLPGLRTRTRTRTRRPADSDSPPGPKFAKLPESEAHHHRDGCLAQRSPLLQIWPSAAALSPGAAMRAAGLSGAPGSTRRACQRVKPDGGPSDGHYWPIVQAKSLQGNQQRSGSSRSSRKFERAAVCSSGSRHTRAPSSVLTWYGALWRHSDRF